MNEYLTVLKRYAVFQGRAGRREFWMFALINLLIGLGLQIVERGFTLGHYDGHGLLSSLYSLAVLVPSIAVSVRRLHDSGRTGWWVLIGLIPILGFIVLLVMMVFDSEPGDNAWGPNPKGVAAPGAA